MAEKTVREMLLQAVESVANEAAGYFCNNDVYCESG